MATTLVIKNANFGTNKLDTVSFSDNPCTGISLSDSTASLAEIGATKTLTATLTPSDTTDILRWSSSDDSVATVSYGVVTATGNGSATITATCGNYSATCEVSVSASFNPQWTVGYQSYPATTSAPVKNYINATAQTASLFAGSLTGTYPLKGTSNPAIYPYKIPNNVTKISVEATGYYIGIAWSNLSQTEYDNYAIALGGNQASSSQGHQNSYVYDVPSGVDSFALTVRHINGDTASASDESDVTVTFITE